MKAIILCLLVVLAFAEQQDVDWGRIKCDACKAGVEVIQQFINDETPVIKKFVHEKCNQVAGSFAPAVCPAVDFEVDNLIKLVESAENPQKACQLVHLCPKPAADIDFNCPACKMVVNWAQKYIQNETSVIEEYVRQECKAVFGKYAPYVCEIVIQELDAILQYIDTGMTAEQICKLVGLCPVLNQADFDFQCPACEMAAKWAQEYLKSKTTTVEEFIEAKCELAFKKYAAFVCPSVLEKVDEILKYVELGLTPREVCQLIKLCKAAKDGCHTEVVCSCCPSKCEVKLVC
jgi:hypothetical protein